MKIKFNKSTFILIIYDAIVVNLSYFLALYLRFDFKFDQIPSSWLGGFVKISPYHTILSIIVLVLFNLYKPIWKFASIDEVSRIGMANILVSLIYVLISFLLRKKMPLSTYIGGFLLQILFISLIRLMPRLLENLKKGSVNNLSKKRVMVIGAGDAGRTIIRELKASNKTNSMPVCIIDDDESKIGRTIDNIPVVGTRDDIFVASKENGIDVIYLAIPSISQEDKREILNICKETGCELKSLPGIYQLVNGDVSVSQMKDVAIEDLLGRESIKVNIDEILENIQDKTILVTGGGGSIGSELCRQIAAHKPKLLIIFDIYENNAYSIEQELKRKYGNALNLLVLIGSVRDTRRINQIFELYHPNIVYHAAAHKHVPLMETSPNEAIKNNVIGTYKTALAAMKNGVEKFVLISTDKAVNPTNIMGASKRLCEMVIQTMDYISCNNKTELLINLGLHNDEMDLNFGKPITRYVAVRFGNVLGSNGSVIPLFKKQIEEGGPVTVTHPDIIRYFMTIPEAVSLVLQAGAYAKGSEIFVLDMGEPVKIDSLARNLIKLSGFKPDDEIKIVYTGLRPGEKLYEEKLMSEEGLEKTNNDLIHIGKPINFDKVEFINKLLELAEKSYNNNSDIIAYVEKIVPTFKHKVY